ncbi:hypothetical protein ACET3Z_027107 [Daucus carota]
MADIQGFGFFVGVSNYISLVGTRYHFQTNEMGNISRCEFDSAILMHIFPSLQFLKILAGPLTSGGDSFGSTFISGAAFTQDTEETEPLCSAAARYIAWILNPIGKSHQDVLAQNLVKMAGKSAPCAKLGLDMLFRRISLGILIGCSDNVNEEGWEILLHYAATSMILQLINTQDTGLRPQQKSQGMEVSIAWNENPDRKEVEKGAILVFYLTDVVENMSVPLTDSEESESDFICQTANLQDDDWGS